MGLSRRAFLAASGAVAGGSVAALAATVAAPTPQPGRGEPAAQTDLVVGACGVCCSKCPAMAAGKCKGCGPATADGAANSRCPVRSCAAKKGFAYCGTDCKGFLNCGKVAGKPYAAEYLQGVARKMA